MPYSVTRYYHRTIKPHVQQHLVGRFTYERRSEALCIEQLAQQDGYVVEIRGGFVHITTPAVALRAQSLENSHVACSPT